ncbi:MAG TPA: hypothetical protein VIM31_02980 [Candidatus Microsaccharimonas sp.]|jgi:hypothetical protein
MSLRKRLGSLVLVFVLALTLGIIGPIETAMAAPWDNRAFSNPPRVSKSYFNNASYFTLSRFNGRLLNYVLTGGIHTTDVASTVAYLKSMNRGPSGSLSQKRDVAGSAFIVQTILGRNGDQANANGGRNISDADFATLTNTLNASSINWNTTVCTNGINTMSVTQTANGPVDITRDPDTIRTQHCEDGISINDASGHQYNIFHRCANPVGDIQGIDGINFNLIPTISGTPAYTDGDSTGANKATLNPSINNTGSTASTSNIQWRVVHFNVAPGVAVPGGGDSGTAPEAFYGHSAAAIANGSGLTFLRNVTNLSVASQVIGDFPIGTRICYALSVQPISQSNGAWRHSTPFCVTIAKSPKFQVHGGDIRVGSNFADQTATSGSDITTSQTTKNR